MRKLNMLSQQLKNSMRNPLVSVIVPTHNRRRSAERLVKSLLRNSYKSIEIIIIDDASTDGTYEYLKSKIKNKKVKVFKNRKNLFTAGTRNIGQEKAKGEYFLFVDDDNVVDANMIDELVQTFKRYASAGEVGPVNYSLQKRKKIFWVKTRRSMWTTKTYHEIRPPKGKSYWNTPDIPNAFMVRSDIIRKHNIKFNGRYGIMYEESDYAYRIRELGYEVFVSRKAKIYHDIEEYSGGKIVKNYMHHFMSDVRRPYVFARNRVIFHKKYSSKLQMMGIYLFWIWFFTSYYLYKIMFYNDSGNFSFKKRVLLVIAYMRGTFNGIIS